MQLDLTDEETLALLNLLTETIETDRYPLSPRVQTLRGILAKFGPMGPTPPARLPPPSGRCARACQAASTQKDGRGCARRRAKKGQARLRASLATPIADPSNP